MRVLTEKIFIKNRRTMSSLDINEVERCANEGESYNTTSDKLKLPIKPFKILIQSQYPDLEKKFIANGVFRKGKSAKKLKKFQQKVS